VTDRSRFDPAAFTTQPFSLRVPKPWGYEILFTPPEKPYTGKLLHVEAGQRLSLQYHDDKQETIMLLHGRGVLVADDTRGCLVETEMEPGKGYSISPGQRHRLVALEACEFIEASTPETGTTYRLEDDSGRGDETAASRESERTVLQDR
jgi:mannose-6-phosphate isomerase-like protein (cupin superfamily)